MASLRLQRLLGGLSALTTLTACGLLLGACGGGTATGPGRPRGPAVPYPVVLADSDERRERALADWAAALGGATAAATGAAPAPELQPVTATALALPPLPAGAAAPRLPRVVIEDEAEQSDEETRESLRRFLAASTALVGSELRDLSLVEIAGAPGGARLARYEQRPFHYPLRNGYGRVEITFTPDLRVTDLSSTAIPDGERLRPLMRNVARQLTAEQAAASLAGRALSYTDAAGAQQSRAAAEAADITPRELVVFPVRRDGATPALELRYAWEIEVRGAGAPVLVYVDAVTGEQLAATPAGDAPAQR